MAVTYNILTRQKTLRTAPTYMVVLEVNTFPA